LSRKEYRLVAPISIILVRRLFQIPSHHRSISQTPSSAKWHSPLTLSPASSPSSLTSSPVRSSPTVPNPYLSQLNLSNSFAREIAVDANSVSREITTATHSIDREMTANSSKFGSVSTRHTFLTRQVQGPHQEWPHHLHATMF
ncbi:unnamed protein product, partial [Linum tenue]